MTASSTPFALTDNAARWVFIATTGFVSVAGLQALGVAVEWQSLQLKLSFFALLLGFSMTYGVIGAQVPRLARPTAIVSDLCLSLLQFLVAVSVFLPLTYLAATPAFPLLDAELAKLDTILFGFEWDTAAQWVAAQPLLEWLLVKAYFSFNWQIFAVLLIGSFTRPGDSNGEFIWQFFIGIIVASAVFVFTPALGKIGHAGTGYLQILTDLRGGLWRVFDYDKLDGIVTFPSFHTTAAILLVYAVRQHGWALAVFVPINVLMIASTPMIGGHYLVDLPGGVVVAVAAIAITKVIRKTRLKVRITPLPVGLALPGHFG
jgi:hypothetical protein